MFSMFNRFQKTIWIKGKPDEKVVLARQSRTSGSNFKNNFVYTALLQEDTRLANGDLFEMMLYDVPTFFLVVSVRKTDDAIQATLYQCNGLALIYRPFEIHDAHDNLIETQWKRTACVHVNHMIINDFMRLLDPGVLPSVTKEFRMQKCDVKLLDRIVLDGEKYVVDAIDNTKFDGLLAVQTSIDNRGL